MAAKLRIISDVDDGAVEAKPMYAEPPAINT
jgi:hypothetical protein